MRCWSARRRLSAYIDGELPPARRERLERHLERCPACTARERELRRAWDVLGTLPPPDDAPSLWTGVVQRLAEPQPRRRADPRPRPFLVPATLAACALAGLIGGALFALRLETLASPRAAAAAEAPPTDTFAEAFGDLGLDPAAATSAAGAAPPSGTAPCNTPQEDAR